VTSLSETLPAETLDRILQASAELRVTWPISLVLDWPAEAPPPDAARLARAARLLVEAEPILACHAEEAGAKGLQWRRHPDLDAVAWLESLVAEDRAAGIRAVLGAEEPATGRNLVVRLIRCAREERHLLVISVSHVVADGSAVYDCAYRLAELYDRLADDPAYRPEPNTASRDSYAWLRALSWRHRLRILRRDLGALRHARTQPMGMPGLRGIEDWLGATWTTPDFVSCRIAPELLGAIDRHAVAQRSSRLEVLAAALARAFHDMLGPEARPAFRLLMPSNLRRFAPVSRRPAIRNMAGFAVMTFPALRDRPFEATLAAATKEGARLRRGLAGATNPVVVALLASMGLPRLRGFIRTAVSRDLRKPCPPTFTNVGRLDERRLRFGGVAPERALLLTAAFPMPLLLITGAEFRGELTLSIGFQAASIPGARLQALLDGMLAELVAAAGAA
jgi:NRPS condensation-like uncharacterized protein